MIRGGFAALSERSFRLLWAGQALSSAGDSLVPVALAFAVVRLTGSAADLGIVLAAETVPRVALTLAAGVWADRLPRNLVMRAADLVRAVVQGLVAVDLLGGHAQVWHLAAAAAAYGTATSFFGPAMSGLVPDTVSPQRLQQANALMSLTRNALGVGGPIAAGGLVAAFGPGWVFAIDAASFVGSAVCLSLFSIPAAIGRDRRAGFLAELSQGRREVTAHAWLWTSLCLFAVGNVAIAFYLVLGPLVAERDFGGAAAWGLWGSGFGLGSVAGAAVSMHVRPRRPLFFGYLLFPITALQPILLAIPAPSAAMAAAAVVAGFGLQVTNTLWFTVLQQQVPRESLSRVSAWDWMVSFLFMPLGYAIAGPVAGALGTRATLLAVGLANVVLHVSVAFVPDVRRITLRTGEEAPAPEAAPAPAV